MLPGPPGRKGTPMLYSGVLDYQLCGGLVWGVPWRSHNSTSEPHPEARYISGPLLCATGHTQPFTTWDSGSLNVTGIHKVVGSNSYRWCGIVTEEISQLGLALRSPTLRFWFCSLPTLQIKNVGRTPAYFSSTLSTCTPCHTYDNGQNL